MIEQFPGLNHKEKKLQEEVFLGFIFEELLEGMLDAMYDTGYNTDEDLENFQDAVKDLSVEERKRLFSLPYELRRKRFQMFHSEGVPIEVVVRRLVGEAETMGYTLGYHLSPFDISSSRGKNEAVWKIKGTEFDDRDEKPMGYYSLDFDNLYRKKHQKYLYVVRAQTGEGSAHGYDPSNNWGRASELSIIGHFDFEQLDAKIKKRMRENENEIKKAA